jgi:shikimate dehydrogenase
MAPRKAAIIGHPVTHSRSPLLHGHWLHAMGRAGSYGRIDVAPADLADFMAGFVAQGLTGCNVTVPHKEAVIPHLAGIDEAAATIGAVNTIYVENGALYGTNTDVLGFLGDLDASRPGWDAVPGEALVLGAGGAARAVLYGLRLRGFTEITILNRSPERAETLARRFGVRPAPLDAFAERAPKASYLVNTTSLGMKGQPPLALDLTPLNPDAIVHDIVYVPLETEFLKAARARGHRTVDGLGMLLHQAVPAFARFFGETPVVTPALRALIEADIRAGGG